jgi:hypothetical protein
VTDQQYLEEYVYIQGLADWQEIDGDEYHRLMDDLVERYNDNQTQAL